MAFAAIQTGSNLVLSGAGQVTIPRVDPYARGFRSLRAALDSGQSGVINVLGDSTGNGTDEWVYLLGQWLGSQHTTHGVVYRLYQATPNTWDPPTTIQAGPSGPRYVQFAGSGQQVQYPGATVPTSGLLRVEAEITPDSWTGGTGIMAAKFGGSGNRGWRFYVGGVNLVFEFSTDGTNQVSTSRPHGLTGSSRRWVAVEFDTDNGAAGYDVRLYTSTDGATWTQLGTTQTGAGPVTMFASTEVLTSGGRGSGGADVFAGKIHSVRVIDAATGRQCAPDLLEFWERAGASQSTITVGGSPTIEIWSASVSGYGVTNLTGELTSAVPPIGQHAFIVSTSHNDGSRTDATFWTSYKALVDHALTQSPSTGVLLTRQNPRYAPATNIDAHAQRAAQLYGLAARLGAGVIDARGAFLAHADPPSLVDNVDGVHPTVAGSLVWRDAVIAAYQGS